MKILILVPVLLSVASVLSCERKPYVEHKLKFEKVSDDCKDRQSYFRMNANFGGERFEFEKCLAADFKKDQMTTERKGDTVLVNFKTASNDTGNKVYHITLDIDSYPGYHYIEIDGDVYTIVSSEK